MTDSQIETIKQIARLNYGYELTTEAAGYVAALANAIGAGARDIRAGARWGRTAIWLHDAGARGG